MTVDVTALQKFLIDEQNRQKGYGQEVWVAVYQSGDDDPLIVPCSEEKFALWQVEEWQTRFIVMQSYPVKFYERRLSGYVCFYDTGDEGPVIYVEQKRLMTR